MAEHARLAEEYKRVVEEHDSVAAVNEVISVQSRVKKLEMVVLQMRKAIRTKRMAEIDAEVARSLEENSKAQEELRMCYEAEEIEKNEGNKNE